MKSMVTASLVLAAVLVAACGGGGDDGGERLSKADFIAQADTICHEAIADVQAIPEPASEEEAQAAFAELKGILDGMLDDLRGLQPPAADEDTLEEMYDKIDRLVTLSGEALDVAAVGDREEYASIETEATQLEDEIKQIAETYGFESCGIEEE